MDASPSSSRAPEAEAPTTRDRPRKNAARQAKHRQPVVTPFGAPWPPLYRIEDGLRRVEPYHWTYKTYCKERWRGRTLIEVFESEFRDRPTEYYRAAMESGLIFINDKCVGPDHVMRNGDLVSHTLHRHEPPVTAEPIGIVHEDDDMIVINKPSGVPVHPAGRYKLNTVIEIIKSERGPDFMPHPCNRLDRLTSGVMFVAKSVSAADALTRKIRQRTVRKEYIARVMGEFPDGEVVCDEPILQISPKLGLNRVRANGKTARTVFKKLAYYPAADQEKQRQRRRGPEDGGQGQGQPWHLKQGFSIVRCLPVTGRTHQIRVHLQYLGHPIQNDPIYANQRVWGLELGRADAGGTANTDEDVISRLSRMGKEEVAQAVVYYDEMVDEYEKRRAERMTGELCAVCETPLYSDPGAHELALWLHSLRYEDVEGAWSYASALPTWALPPEGVAGPTTVGGMQELVQAAGESKGADPDPDPDPDLDLAGGEAVSAEARKPAGAAQSAEVTRPAEAAQSA